MLKTYHSLPPKGRAFVASVHGLSLARWRYGPETPKLVDEAISREAWSSEEWRAWHARELAGLLGKAATRVPYYRDLWGRRGLSESVPERLEDWPVLRKDALRESPRAFLAGGMCGASLRREQTSGTTGKPITIWATRNAARRWYALFEARTRRWSGVTRSDRWGILGGRLVVPVEQDHPPFWVWSHYLHQLYFSSYHISRQTVGTYLEAMRDYRIAYLYGYASSLHALAQLSAEAGLRAPRLKVAISNAEPLLRHQRQRIGEVFECPVRDTYGMAEAVCGASECAEGGFHLWPDAGVIEILRDSEDVPVLPGQAGRIVATGLLNEAMPLIRYETGDRGALEPAGLSCACGRRLPLIRSVEGRCDDVIVTPAGRIVGRLDPVFKSAFAIREAQILQEAVDWIRVIVVPTDGFRARDAEGISQALMDRVGGGVKIDVETVEKIPRTEAGKFRAVVSRVPLDRAHGTVASHPVPGSGTGPGTVGRSGRLPS